MSRSAQWAAPESPRPLALPLCSGFGLDPVAFRPFEGLLRFKDIPADRGQAVPSRCGVSLASVDASCRRASKPHFGVLSLHLDT